MSRAFVCVTRVWSSNLHAHATNKHNINMKHIIIIFVITTTTTTIMKIVKKKKHAICSLRKQTCACRKTFKIKRNINNLIL